MSTASRFLLPAALLAFAGVQWFAHVRQSERLESLEREVVGLREEVRAAKARAPLSDDARPVAATEPPMPPEVFAAQVAQHVEARLQARAQTPAASATPGRPPPLLPEDRPLFDRAQLLVESTLAARELRSENVEELRSAIARLGPTAEAYALRKRLIVAVNRGELKLPPGLMTFP